MVFASLTFLFYFLPIHLILYYALDSKTYKNITLTFFSLLFYAWGEPIWVVLLVASATVDYGNGLLVERFRDTAWAKVGLWASVVFNLGLLALFKYNVFIYENVNWLLGTDFKAPSYSLPIGISFYSFQTISYVVDVYRGEVKAQRSYLKFLMFVSLFHQLVAGPIVRYAHIENEINNREHKLHDINQGILRFCIGLFKKVFIADVAGSLAMAYLGTYDPVALELDPSLDVATKLQTVSVAGAWFGIIMFSIQIYFDFSGYSDMAIGLGRMFGFHYHENFNYPYIAKSATEFWRRWHISLGTFFRDYIYIPLGGNRKNAILNLFIVWFLTGLWHGSSWNFVLWGLYFGVLIYLERLFLFKIFKRLPNFVSHVYLILIAILGWGIFYFEDWGHLSQFFAVLFGDINWTGDVLINTVIQEYLGNVRTVWDPLLGVKIMEYIFWIVLSIILCMPIYPIFSKWLEGGFKENRPALYTLVVSLIQIGLLIISIAMLTDNTYNAFIYFRF